MPCFRLLGLGLIMASQAGLLFAELRPPELLLTEARLREIRELAVSDPLMKDLLQAIRTDAEANLDLAPLGHEENKNGSRLDTYRATAGRIQTAAFMYRLDGDARFLASAKRELMAAIEAPEWNTSHYLDVSEMSFGVAMGYDWLWDALTIEERAAIRSALFTNILEMAPEAYEPRGRGGLNWAAFGSNPKTTNNWNFVCNTGFIAAALVLQPEHSAEAGLVLKEAPSSLRLAMAGYAPDGAWPEGATYWIYGTTFLCHSLALLEDGLGSDFGLLEQPGLEETIFYGLQFFGPSGVSFNFGDGGPARSHQAVLAGTVWLAHHYDHPEVLPTVRERLRDRLEAPISGYEQSLPVGGRTRNLIASALFFPARNEAEAARPPLASHFRGDADMAILRSPEADGFWVALKGGTNGQSHGHLDLGSFVLDAMGIRWAIDLGSETYSFPGFWEYEQGGRRWSYFRNNNRSHNTLTMGDVLQQPDATAPVIEFSPWNDENGASAVLDLTSVYPGQATRLLRRVHMSADGATVLMQDDIEKPAPKSKATWRMLTAAAITLSDDGRTATLHEATHTLFVQLVSPLDHAVRFQVEAATPPTAREKSNDGVSILMVDFTPAGTSRLAVTFTPSPAKAQP